ncbi:MAG: PilZ domain-containing protein [Candidatus Omnitrophota bacterium]
MTVMERSVDTRRYRRVTFKRSVKVSRLSRDVFDGNLSQDISQGGLRIFSTDFLPLHTLVTVRVQLRDEARVLEFPAKVVWVRVQPLSENFQIGLEFLDDQLRPNEEVARFVKSL